MLAFQNLYLCLHVCQNIRCGILSYDRRDSAPGMLKGIVVDQAFTWGVDQAPRIPWHKSIIYEVHVKGFTARHPDVPQHLRGTYAALGTAPVIDYFTRLGITAVELMPVHTFMTYAAFFTVTAQIIFVINLFWSMKKGAKATPNPWEATTLEWTVPSPPPFDNFAGVHPVVNHGPYEYGVPGAPRDYVMQTDPPLTGETVRH